MQISSSIPLYARISETLADEITSGRLVSAARLPTEDELMTRFSVSRTTVRSAIQGLLKVGLVEIRRGRGTFVARPKLVQELTSLTGFVEDMNAAGRRASARVLGKAVVHADGEVARRLDCAEGREVVRIRRLRLADDVPLSLDETYLPLELGRKVMEDDLEHDPIFPLLEGKYGTPLIEADYELAAVSAGAMEAGPLEVVVGAPIFLVERTSFSHGRRPVDYEKLFYRGDSIRFSTRLARRTAETRP